MRQTYLTIVYFVSNVWLIVAAIARILIQITTGIPLDVLPFISATLGVLALLLLRLIPKDAPKQAGP